MADLVVIVPSRGRPAAVESLAEAFRDTCTAATELLIVVDMDDAELPGYKSFELRAAPFVKLVGQDERAGMVGALNWAAREWALPEHVAPSTLAFMGDDHRPRTKGWDTAYLEALKARPGMVYGNDLIQGAHLPTQIAMSTSVVRALGHMAPPSLTHLYVDNYWLALGRAAGCVTYLPDVVVEHLHPVAGKAAMDEGYVRVNAPEMYQRDAAAFAAYLQEHLAREVDLVRQAVAGVRA